MSDIVLSRDLANSFIEIQKAKIENEKRQRDLVSPIHHHCFRCKKESKYELGRTYFEVIAVNLVKYSILIRSYSLILELSVQGSNKKRMEFTYEEINLDDFLSSQNYEEITKETFVINEVYYSSQCDDYYDTKGFRFKHQFTTDPNWIW